MSKIFILIIAVGLFSGCTQQPKIENMEEEILVIHSTFYKATYAMSKNDHHDMMRFGPIFPPAGSPKFKITNDTALRAGKHLFLAEDSLFSINSFRFFSPKVRTNKEINPDSIYQLLQSRTHKSLKANFSIDSISYRISDDKSLKKNEDFNGTLTFSRVVFNKQKNKACYYFEQYILIGTSRGWGVGNVVYAEKKNGNWVFVKEENIWIA
ncbi:hypothetical protein [Pedobacter frigiditerrae]|uniref:hypothetical protein n=1 Tax=Pedobacter frigiditerrae TaxID=2530452 RepID=UPI00293116B0|nr:hypothetical protein [Pedobacter frigiditerrae]